ncbi:MAG: glutamate racemase [Patescibacteria group bacterium]
MNKKPIGVFDSGVGGLSVLVELQKLLPNENFVFLADQLNVPYGEKSKKELVKFAFQITDYFIKNHKIKQLVIACNTSTCYSIDSLRKKYSKKNFLPIVGTVPALKPASQNTKSGTVAVISTPATSKSPVMRKFIRDFAKGIKVLNIGCQNLENVVEEGEIDSPKAILLLEKYLKQIKNSKADHLVLACTHYPFLRKTIQKIVGPHIKLIDSGKAIARRTKSLLLTHRLKNKQNKKGKTLYFTTGNAGKFSRVASRLLKNEIKSKKARL